MQKSAIFGDRDSDSWARVRLTDKCRLDQMELCRAQFYSQNNINKCNID
ncbi:hypothetical protein PUN28_018507 [Cardiocondyla obscurior]|uniref:Uncharacterized protein n=1 Tax=Cardiocondyla obscurior TaxID=286306 RepID=A0AAW2EE46_9HYME